MKLSDKSDGAFYTKDIPAAMLVGLALKPALDNLQYIFLAKMLQIIDPACGAGILLKSSIDYIQRWAKDPDTRINGFGAADDTDSCIRHLLEEGLHGFDINPDAVEKAKSRLSVNACDNILAVEHGIAANGDVRLGSLDMLVDVFRERTTRKKYDILIMNPPYTNSAKRGVKYSESIRKRMQQKESEIKQVVARYDPFAASAIDFNSLGSFFIPLAECLLNEDTGVMGVVMPTTACSSPASQSTRKFIASRFFVDMIATCHEPGKKAFSENTNIYESLLICRRRNKGNEDLPTRFISLKRLPHSIEDAHEWADAAALGMHHAYHRVFLWPRSRIEEGDWAPAQYYDGSLAEEADKVDALNGMAYLGSCAKVEPALQSLSKAFENPLQSLGNVAEVGPLDRCVRRTFENPLKPAKPVQNSLFVGTGAPDSFEVAWTHKTSDRETMLSFSDYTTVPRAGMHNYATGVLWPKASRLLVACRINPQVIRVCAILLPKPALGQAFIPVTPAVDFMDTAAVMQAWCAYLNSTPAVLSFLNRRQKNLNYASFPLVKLRGLPVPDPMRIDISPLVKVFKEIGGSKLKPWPLMDKCKVRESAG